MRGGSFILALICLGAGAQEAPPARWTLGLLQQAPTLSGDYRNQDLEQATRYDIDRDLGLARSGTRIGLLGGYEGPRLRFQVSSSPQDYRGDHVLAQPSVIGGRTFPAGTRLQGRLRTRVDEVEATVKVWRGEAVFLGLDLAVSSWSLDLSAQGFSPLGGTTVPLPPAYSSTQVTVPQLGISAGIRPVPPFEARAFARALSRSGASYRHAGLDLRYFPRTWLGLRASFEQASARAPMGSLDAGTELHLEARLAGLGLLLRY